MNSIESLQKTIAEAKETIAYRAQNYYNCVDDYSSGGICDIAAQETINRCENLIGLLEVQNEKGYVEVQSKSFKMRNLKTGNCEIVTSRRGKYGMFFVFEGNIYSASVKQSTFNKKGVELIEVDTNYNVIYTGGLTQNGNPKIKTAIIASQKETVNEKINYSGTNSYLDFIYTTLN